MNAAKKKVIDIITGLPDDSANEYEVLDQAYILARLEKSRESIAQNGGIPHSQLKAFMDGQRQKMSGKQ